MYYSAPKSAPWLSALLLGWPWAPYTSRVPVAPCEWCAGSGTGKVVPALRKDGLLSSSAQSGTGAPLLPHELAKQAAPNQPSPRADPRAASRCVSQAKTSTFSSPWPHRPLPQAVTETDGPGDTAGTQLTVAWHVAGLGKSKSWKLGDPADIPGAQFALYSPASEPRASAPVISSPL